MLKTAHQRRFNGIMRGIVTVVLTAFITTSLVPPQKVYAQSLVLPLPGTMLKLTNQFMPAMVKGIKVDPNNPLAFNFLIDPGQTPMSDTQKKEEYRKLIKYFLASLTTPEKDMWVNLSPYEHNRIITQNFGDTEMGRDMLGQDYILKQLTASIVYPEDALGQKFWSKVYAQVQQKFGSAEVPVNTFNKVWIIPSKATIFEKGNVAMVVDSHLKVLLEQDYLSLDKNANSVKMGLNGMNDQVKGVNAAASQVVREIVIPELEKEVNNGEHFAQLRQMFNSMVLASWFKQRLHKSVLAQVYANKNKNAGVALDDKDDNERIYQQYIKAFKKGVYNYIKEEPDPVSGDMIPRKYFSGGTNFGGVSKAMGSEGAVLQVSPAMQPGVEEQQFDNVDVALTASSAMPTTPLKEAELKVAYVTASGAGEDLMKNLIRTLTNNSSLFTQVQKDWATNNDRVKLIFDKMVQAGTSVTDAIRKVMGLDEKLDDAKIAAAAANTPHSKGIANAVDLENAIHAVINQLLAVNETTSRTDLEQLIRRLAELQYLQRVGAGQFGTAETDWYWVEQNIVQPLLISVMYTRNKLAQDAYEADVKDAQVQEITDQLITKMGAADSDQKDYTKNPAYFDVAKGEIQAIAEEIVANRGSGAAIVEKIAKLQGRMNDARNRIETEAGERKHANDIAADDVISALLNKARASVTPTPTAAPAAGTTAAAPVAGTTAAPVAGTTAAPVAGTTAAAPVAGTTAAPVAGTTAAPVAGTTAAPVAGTTAAPAAGTTAAAPIAGTTAAAPVAGTTAAPAAGTTAAPVAGTTPTPTSTTVTIGGVAITLDASNTAHHKSLTDLEAILNNPSRTATDVTNAEGLITALETAGVLTAPAATAARAALAPTPTPTPTTVTIGGVAITLDASNTAHHKSLTDLEAILNNPSRTAADVTNAEGLITALETAGVLTAPAATAARAILAPASAPTPGTAPKTKEEHLAVIKGIEDKIKKAEKESHNQYFDEVSPAYQAKRNLKEIADQDPAVQKAQKDLDAENAKKPDDGKIGTLEAELAAERAKPTPDAVKVADLVKQIADEKANVPNPTEVSRLEKELEAAIEAAAPGWTVANQKAKDLSAEYDAKAKVVEQLKKDLKAAKDAYKAAFSLYQRQKAWVWAIIAIIIGAIGLGAIFHKDHHADNGPLGNVPMDHFTHDTAHIDSDINGVNAILGSADPEELADIGNVGGDGQTIINLNDDINALNVIIADASKDQAVRDAAKVKLAAAEKAKKDAQDQIDTNTRYNYLSNYSSAVNDHPDQVDERLVGEIRDNPLFKNLDPEADEDLIAKFDDLQARAKATFTMNGIIANVDAGIFNDSDVTALQEIIDNPVFQDTKNPDGTIKHEDLLRKSALQLQAELGIPPAAPATAPATTAPAVAPGAVDLHALTQMMTDGFQAAENLGPLSDSFSIDDVRAQIDALKAMLPKLSAPNVLAVQGIINHMQAAVDKVTAPTTPAPTAPATAPAVAPATAPATAPAVAPATAPHATVPAVPNAASALTLDVQKGLQEVNDNWYNPDYDVAGKLQSMLPGLSPTDAQAVTEMLNAYETEFGSIVAPGAASAAAAVSGAPTTAIGYVQAAASVVNTLQVSMDRINSNSFLHARIPGIQAALALQNREDMVQINALGLGLAAGNADIQSIVAADHGLQQAEKDYINAFHSPDSSKEKAALNEAFNKYKAAVEKAPGGQQALSAKATTAPAKTGKPGFARRALNATGRFIISPAVGVVGGVKAGGVAVRDAGTGVGPVVAAPFRFAGKGTLGGLKATWAKIKGEPTAQTTTSTNGAPTVVKAPAGTTAPAIAIAKVNVGDTVTLKGVKGTVISKEGNDLVLKTKGVGAVVRAIIPGVSPKFVRVTVDNDHPIVEDSKPSSPTTPMVTVNDGKPKVGDKVQLLDNKGQDVYAVDFHGNPILDHGKPVKLGGTVTNVKGDAMDFLRSDGKPDHAKITDDVKVTPADPGGIDFDAKYLDLNMQGEGMNVPCPKGFEWLLKSSIRGFIPQILEIRSGVGFTLSFFKGLLTPEQEQQAAKNHQQTNPLAIDYKYAMKEWSREEHTEDIA